jgi:pimeloyl-ACP methyl ester carboxylesterase
MTTGQCRIAIAATATLLTAGAAAAATVVARRATATSHPTVPQLELTPSHRAGTGSPLLLLHGITAFWRAWSPILPYLEPHHDVIVPTLPGHGGGPRLDPQTAPSVEALVDGIEELLDGVGLPTVHIAGNSLGGWVGIELARRGRARSLVLFSPAGAWRSQRSTELRAIGIGLLVGSMRSFASRADFIATNPMLRRMVLARQVAHPDRYPTEVLAAWFRSMAIAPDLARLLRAIPRRQVQPLPADRNYPVRLVWCEHDRVIPFDGFGSVMLERLPGAELVELAGVGHVPMSDDPAAVANLILEVAAGVDSAAMQREA